MKPTKKTARRTSKAKKNPSAALGKVKRNKWFDAKKVRIKSTSRGPVLEIRK